MSILIKGGRVITAADDYVGDVYVEDERISLIGESLDQPADKVIDAPASTCCRGRRPAHASRHALRRHGHDRRRRVGPDLGRVRRHDCHVDFIIQPQGSTFAEAIESGGARRTASR
jgi:dihydropyrimidinase